MLDDTPTPDLEALTKVELEALQRKVQEALSKAEARRRQDAIAAVKRAVQEHGFTLDDLSGLMTESPRKRAPGAKTERAIQFRNPENPNETWSGRGRRPGWFNAQIEAGKSQDELRA